MKNKTKETTRVERKIVLNLYAQGKSYSEISKVINRSRFATRSVIK